ncbi:MAG: YjbH domain-containing protein [Rheinheimera sp.]|nr:YjbH domain-containing protein [Rheinheimera sp.]
MPEQLPAASTKVESTMLYQQLRAEVGFVVINYQLQPNEVIIEGYSTAFRHRDEFLERLGRLLAAELPETVKRYRIRELSDDTVMVETVIDAEKFVSFARRDEIDATLAQSIQRQEPTPVNTDWQLTTENSGYYQQMDGYWIQSFGNPETFYLYQIGVVPAAGYVFNKNFSVNGALRIPLLTNFDDFTFTVDAIPSTLPRVRTYVREYVEADTVSVENIYLQAKTQLVQDWYGLAYAGLLESMYTGAGAEVLYRPVDSRLAVGIDVNYVAQRDFEDPFAVRDYRVATGHVTAYWNPEMFDDLLVKVSVGRYLAKDKGVTLDIAKRFDSGIVVGAYAAKTNVSAAEYGEGSFTKGFYLNFPFDLFSATPSTGATSLPWVPITRDGGQPLSRPGEVI